MAARDSHTLEVGMFKGTLRISGTEIDMLQIDYFSRGTILAENDEFLTIRWPALHGSTLHDSSSGHYPAFTVVYRKDSVTQCDRGGSVERLIGVTPVIEWESRQTPRQAGQAEN